MRAKCLQGFAEHGKTRQCSQAQIPFLDVVVDLRFNRLPFPPNTAMLFDCRTFDRGYCCLSSSPQLCDVILAELYCVPEDRSGTSPIAEGFGQSRR